MASGRPRSKRTAIQIQCPDIIGIPGLLPAQATKDKELGTDQRHGMVATTAGPRTTDRDAGPLS